jgi:hypothetical protein
MPPRSGLGHPALVAELSGRLRYVFGNSFQSQHVLHAVQPRLALGEPASGAQRAMGESVAAMGAMDEFEALADFS